MNFHRKRGYEEPEINLIPLIDLLLVILIFLMITTTYNKLNGFDIELPSATDADSQNMDNHLLRIVVSGNSWQVNEKTVDNVKDLQDVLQKEAINLPSNTWVVILADANAPYQKIADTMQVARQVNLTKITLQTQVK